ncbi:CSS-motif domain-containing protein [Aeromonas taiwanensis]|uniref:CSS-motif domain-containing protein n=1 Tax=Aeromonas taiwanensis TaxID=633417 RepID=UPI003BA32A45
MLKSVAGNQRIYLGSFISLLLFLLAGHYSTLAFQKNKQLAFSKNILIKSDEVTLQLATSLRDVNQAGLIECDKPSIDKIRIIASNYPYVDDIGLAEGDKLICTANWGILEKQSRLPRHDFITASGFEVYLKPRDLFPSRLIRNMTRLGNVVAFSSRLRAEQIYKDTTDFSYELVTRNGEHKFISSAGSPTASTPLSTLSTRLCSDAFDYCIVTYNDRAGILAYHPLLITLYCIIAICFGGLIAFSVTSYQEEKRSLEFRLIRAIKREELREFR